jgi:hypothetical protein
VGEQTFAEATHDGSAAVMIISRPIRASTLRMGHALRYATPGRWPRTARTATLDGFQSFLVALRNDTIAFEKPVVLVYGDSHYFRIDKPLATPGPPVENFTRVETFGDNAGERAQRRALGEGARRPASRDVFAFQPQIVPAKPRRRAGAQLVAAGSSAIEGSAGRVTADAPGDRGRKAAPQAAYSSSSCGAPTSRTRYAGREERR